MKGFYHIQAGIDGSWEPSAEEMAKLTDMFNAVIVDAEKPGVGAIRRAFHLVALCFSGSTGSTISF